MVPGTVAGSAPMFSTTSISPQAGQPTAPMSSPSNNNAGHRAWPRGILLRASTWPCRAVKRPAVFGRAEVYSHLPYRQWWSAGFSRRASTTRRPSPSSQALSVPEVWYWCSALLSLSLLSLSPGSGCRRESSTAEPAGPSKVSSKTTCSGRSWGDEEEGGGTRRWASPRRLRSGPVWSSAPPTRSTEAAASSRRNVGEWLLLRRRIVMTRKVTWRRPVRGRGGRPFRGGSPSTQGRPAASRGHRAAPCRTG